MLVTVGAACVINNHNTKSSIASLYTHDKDKITDVISTNQCHTHISKDRNVNILLYDTQY